MSQFRKAVVSSAAWSLGMRFTVNSLGILSIAILARLLDPEDFGIVALAGSAYAFLSVLGQFGFDSALIHIKNPSDDHLNSAWTANILVGVLVCIGMLLIANPAADFFGDPRMASVVYAMSLLSLAKGFENIGIVYFRKELKFRGDFLYFVIPKIVSISFGVVFAILLKNYWALVYGMISAQIATLLYSYIAHPYRPRLSLRSVFELFQFSRWILGNNLLRFLSINGLDIILGRIRIAADVGILGIARDIAFIPTSEVIAPLNRALFPSFAAIQNDPGKTRELLLRALAMTMLISLPMAFGILSIAEIVVLVLLGEKWIAVTPILSVLVLVGIIDAVRGLFVPLLLAKGRPKVITVMLGIIVIISVPLSILLAEKMGALGVAYSMLAAALVGGPFLVHVGAKEANIKFKEIVLIMYRPLLSSVVMLIALWLITDYFGPMNVGDFTRFATMILLGAIIYVACVVGLWLLAGKPPGAEREIVRLFKGQFLSGKPGL